jgi:hypothetical protein
MKKVIFLLALGYLFSCNEPLEVTGKTDPQATTSGTLGSVKASNQMPALDTPANKNRVDTSRKQ